VNFAPSSTLVPRRQSEPALWSSLCHLRVSSIIAILGQQKIFCTHSRRSRTLIHVLRKQTAAIKPVIQPVTVEVIPITVPLKWVSDRFLKRTYPCGCTEAISFRLVIQAYGETIRTGYYIMTRCPVHFVQDIVNQHCRCFDCQRIIIPGDQVGVRELPKNHPPKNRLCLYSRGLKQKMGVLTCVRQSCSSNQQQRKTWDGTHVMIDNDPLHEVRTIISIV
jgi:hypothetical protein